MTLREIPAHSNTEVLCGKDYCDGYIHNASACELISGIPSSHDFQALLITSLTNTHVTHTSDSIHAPGVIVAGDRKSSIETIEVITKHSTIPVLATRYAVIDCCGLLFAHGVKAYTKDSL